MRNFIAALSILLFVACSTDDGESPRSIVDHKYVNTAIGVTLQFPATWTLKVDQKLNQTVLDVVALGAPVGGYSPNMNLVIENHTGSSKMEEIIPIFKASLIASEPSFGNFTDTIREYNGIKYGDIKYTASSGGTEFMLNQLLILNKNKEVTITFIDFASRFEANMDIPAIKQSLEIK